MGRIALIIGLILVPLLGFAQPDTMWTRTIDSTFIDLIVDAPDGGYFICGHTVRPNGDNSAIWRLDSDGYMIWRTLFNDSLNNVSSNYSLITTPDSGCVLLSEWSYYATILLKLSIEGEIEWTYLMNPPSDGYEYPKTALVTRNGGYLIAGEYYEFTPENGISLTMLDQNGEFLWSRRYYNWRSNYDRTIYEENNGNIILLYNQPNWPDNTAYSIRRIDGNNGDVLTSLNVEGPGSTYAKSLEGRVDGGFSIIGLTEVFTETPRIFSMETDSNGIVIESHYGDTIGGFSNSWQRLMSGNYVFAGYNPSYESNPEGYFITLIDTTLSVEWTAYYLSDSTYFSKDVCEAEDGGLVIVGYSNETRCSYIVKTNPVLAADNRPQTQPSSFALHPCYPNPFNPTTTLSFDLTNPGMVKLNVFDITGRQVSTLIEKNMTAGLHQVLFDGSDLASGIYFARLVAGETMQTRKMILLK